MSKTSDKLKVGEKYEPLTLHITPELNNQFIKAIDCSHKRYEKIVHPCVFFNFCSITQSPSFFLDRNIEAVGAKFENGFMKKAKVDKKYHFSWKVVGLYERRSRTYQICDVLVVDEDGNEIIKRKINNTFIGGEYLERRVKWEKETGYRRALQTNEFSDQGYEIGSKERKITIDKLRSFSGGLPGANWPARNIHTDREISIRSGIGRVIASGLMFESYIAELLINFIGEEWLTYGQTRLVSIDMAGDGDTVTAKSVLKNPVSEIDLGKISLDVWCENQFGNRIIVGSANGIKYNM